MTIVSQTFRRRLSLFAVVFGCLSSLTAYCKPASPERALAVAKGWLRAEATPLGEALGKPSGEIETVRSDAGDVLYHVIKLEPAGFAIVAGDDTVEPMIAFSSKGAYVGTPDNPLYALLKEDLSGRVNKGLQLRAAVPGDAVEKWNKLEGVASLTTNPLISAPPDVRVAPVVASKWGQTTASGLACYNYYTPDGTSYGTNGNPKNYPCGCVATAMAQIMRYHRWPTGSVGTAQYTVYVDNSSTYKRTRGGDGKGGAYLWDTMPLDATGATLAQRQAIGALTYDAGVAAQMQYASIAAGGSGAYLSKAKDAFLSPFHFTNAVYGNYGLASTAALMTMINPNLDARMPVLLGIDTLNLEGHAIVCDGYGYSGGTMYHHLNLGWSGDDDAWYTLPSINTSEGAFTAIPDLIYNLFTNVQGEIISGRIVETTGHAIPNVSVTASNSPVRVYTALTDSNGVYALCGVAASAQYSITASKSGYFTTNLARSTQQSVSGASQSGNVWGADFVLVRSGAPVILTQPEDQKISEGGTATFTVSAVGQPPLTYAWTKNGVAISGATNASYTVINAAVDDSGAAFNCAIGNSSGKVTSRNAILTVLPLVIDHFVLSEVSSPEAVNQPFEMTVTAYDSLGTVVSNYNGNLTLSGTQPIYSPGFSDGFENGFASLWSNEQGSYKRQVSTFAASGSKSLTLIGGISTGYDGVQHAFAEPVRPDRVSFFVCAAQTNEAAGYVVAGMAKYRTNSVFHFRMDTSGTMGLTDGDVRWHGVPYRSNQWYKIALNIDWTNRTVDYYVDDALAETGVSFCNPEVTNISVVNLYNVGKTNTQAWWDQIEFFSEVGVQAVSLAPTQLGNFTGGRWTGGVSIYTLATNLVLTVSDGAGHTGVGNAFSVNSGVSKPPVIVSQPMDARVLTGADATFSVGATGGRPMTFAWYRDGVPIPGASATNYTIQNVSFADSHSRFSCLVGNAAGSVSTRDAVLTVITTNHVRVAIVSSDGVAENDDVKAKLLATGGFDDMDVDVYSSYSPPLPTLDQLRGYAAVLVYSYVKFPSSSELGNTLADYVDSGGGLVLGYDALSSTSGYGVTGRLGTNGYLPFIPGPAEPLTGALPNMSLIPDLPEHPLLAGVNSLDNGTLGMRNKIKLASGATQVAHWSTLEPLACFTEINGSRVVALNFYPPSSDVVDVAWNSETDGGVLMANALRWAARDQDRMPPYIAMQPQDQTVGLGDTASFEVSCYGAAPLDYQWQKDGQPLLDGGNISGSTSSKLTIAATTLSDGASYSVVVSNSRGTVTSANAVLAFSIPPVIDVQPANVTAYSGERVVLSVQATGSLLKYSWRKGSTSLADGGVISGAKTATLILNGVSPADSGSYSVLVSNSYGVAFSYAVTVAVYGKPVITSQPVSRTNALGAAATLSVFATGGDLSYQWRRGGIDVQDDGNRSGCRTASLRFGATLSEDGGFYTVVVSNRAGAVESKQARLVVLAPPALANDLREQVVEYGANATFRISATGAAPLSYRWFKDGIALNNRSGKVSGAQTSNLVIRVVGTNDPGVYSVVVSNAVGGQTSSGARLRIAPSLKVTYPAATLTVTNPALDVKGSAADPGGPGLQNVVFRINEQGFEPATGLSSWTGHLILVPGTNYIEAKSIDLDGLESKVVSSRVIYNPYASQAGTYSGLFSDTNSSAPDRTGFVSVNLTKSGVYSGRIYRGGTSAAISGKFDWNGQTQCVIANSPGVALAITLPIGTADAGMNGVFSGPGWSAVLKSVRGASTAKAVYTLALENNGENPAGPGGDGFATSSLGTTGSMAVSGRLPDDTAFTAIAASVSADGTWPIYSSLLGGKGLLAGWLNLDRSNGLASGSLSWTEVFGAGKSYAGGFTNQIQVEGSVLPAGRLLGLTNGLAILNGGSLETAMTNQVLQSSANSLKPMPGQTNGLTLSINRVSGQVSGTIIDPATRHKLTIKGVILNRQNEARGYFGAPQGGWFLLRGDQ